MANEYVTDDELKATLSLTGTTFADADVTSANGAASRAIDKVCGRFFYTSTQTRYYSPDNEWRLEIHDLNDLTSLKTDPDGDGTFQYTWTEHTDFELEPLNAATDGEPWTAIRRRPAGGYYLPCLMPRSVQVIGDFGWAATPPAIVQAASILATRLLVRSRQAPLAVLINAETAARIASTDPDVAALVEPFVKQQVLVG